MKSKLTQDELKKHLHYNPDTGIFTRLTSRGGEKVGSIAGCVCNDGYVKVCVNGKNYRAHRLANLYMLGYFPEHDMDHKKGIRHDNRWNEIEHATRSCNAQNKPKSIKNTSGFTGVYWGSLVGKWCSQIKVNGKQISIGYFKSKLEAALARYTVEVNCKEWKCNYRSDLVASIKEEWPEFDPKCTSRLWNVKPKRGGK